MTINAVVAQPEGAGMSVLKLDNERQQFKLEDAGENPADGIQFQGAHP